MSRTRTWTKASIGLSILAALALTPMGATAQELGNRGTVKVHDNETADPPTRNEPHVCDDFWVQGFGMSEDSGELVVFSWPPTGDKTEVLRADWDGTDAADGNGFDFLEGPFFLSDNGHYRLEVFVASDADHKAKSKMFWIDCAPTPPDGEEEDDLECPTDLRATANQEGSVTLTWTDATGADGANVYRADGDGDFEYLETVAAGVESYTDTTTVAGQAYTYIVTALFGDRESVDCDEVMVTAIPDFPVPIAAALAVVGGTLAYAGLRRRT